MRSPPAPARLAALLIAMTAVVSCGRIVHLDPGDPVSFVRQPQTSKILAADGSVLAELHAAQDREEVPLEEVDPVLARAVVATEDRRFFLHRGVDGPAILRAAVANLEEGEIEEGGSTITQQYVKNTMTGNARTIGRKLREAALAYQLEQRYSKDEILERYLNTVYFGRGAYGVHAAAQRFFGSDAGDVTLPEAAQLAGMIASPSRFDPYDHPERAAARRGAVLDAMVEAGHLDAGAAEEAAGQALDLASPEPSEPAAAPYAVAEVKRRLQHDPEGDFEVLGEDVDERADRLFTGGLRVHTSIDPGMQAQAEAAVDEVLPARRPAAAVVATDPRSGAVRALVGGRGYSDPEDGAARFNLATQARRQPGSAFKPIVLASALRRGVDIDRRFPGGDCVSFPEVDGWEPCNYQGLSYPPLTLREATVRSVNTVFARLTVDLGPTAVLEMARTLGFEGELPQVPSLGLGAGEVSPIEMAGAYGAFATLGRYAPPHLVTRIETADGDILYERPPTSYRVMEESVAYLVTQTLQDVVERGTAVQARIDRPQAGKTGTSQDNADAWFVGYTPSLVAAVWVGFPEARTSMVPPHTSEVVEGGRWPAQVWRSFAEAALSELPPEPFPVPEVGVVRVEVDTTRNCLPNPYTPPEAVEVREYLAGTEPTERCSEPTGPPVDDVPEVTGIPLEVAERLLRDEGFVLEVRREASDIYPPGIVTRQRPEPGGTTRAEDDNAVIVWVSANPRTRSTVPPVVGTDLEAAVATLEEAGFVVEVERGCPEAGCAGSPGEVWIQTPEAGERIRDHSVVTVTAYPGESEEPEEPEEPSEPPGEPSPGG